MKHVFASRLSEDITPYQGFLTQRSHLLHLTAALFRWHKTGAGTSPYLTAHLMPKGGSHSISQSIQLPSIITLHLSNNTPAISRAIRHGQQPKPFRVLEPSITRAQPSQLDLAKDSRWCFDSSLKQAAVQPKKNKLDSDRFHYSTSAQIYE